MRQDKTAGKLRSVIVLLLAPDGGSHRYYFPLATSVEGYEGNTLYLTPLSHASIQVRQFLQTKQEAGFKVEWMGLEIDGDDLQCF